MDNDGLLTHNQQMIEEFRQRGGTLESFGDSPVLLLTTTGAKSGAPRTSPMMYLADDSDPNLVYVFASYAGSDVNPAWFHNLVAHPEVVVEIGAATVPATARVLPEEERAKRYAVQAGRYPGFAEYESKTTRVIPVVALTLHRE